MSSSSNKLNTTNRDFRFDNLRGLAVICVVIAHLIETSNLGSFGFIRHCFFVFMIPLLFFISGYFSKDSLEGMTSAFKNILIPYFFFDAIWIVFMFFIDNSRPDYPFLIAGWGLWYLMSLFIMRFFLPGLNRIKHIFLISLVVATIAGAFTFHSTFLSWYRTLYFLPAFLLGFYFPKFQDKFKPKLGFNLKPKLKYLIFLILIIIIPLGAKLRTYEPTIENFNVLLSTGFFEGIVIRFILIVLSLVVTVLLVYLARNKITFLTKIGRNSLAVYILGFYFIIFFHYFFNKVGLSIVLNDFVLSALYIICFTILIVFISSRDFVTNTINRTISKINKFFFKSER
jgi:fucose 4-O-acetylase-like acetyltransferase